MLSEVTPLPNSDTGGEMKTERGSASVLRAGEGILGRGQLRGVMGGVGAASNYIQGVKPSITTRLACLSSCYSCKRRATLQEHIPSMSDEVCAGGL